jgi:hypothetical protein
MGETTTAHSTKTEAAVERAVPPIDRVPLAFTDTQLDVIMSYAAPLHPRLRRAFVEHVAVALGGMPIGDGNLYRACRQVLKEMFDPPDLGSGHVSKWSR